MSAVATRAFASPLARSRALVERHPGIGGLILFGAVAGLTRPSSFRTPIGRDTGAYLYVGDVILHGGTPYVDAANNKGPLTYLLFALFRAVSGTSVVALRLTLLVFAALAALALAGYVAHFAGRGVGLLAGVTLAALSSSFPFPADDPNTEQYGIAPMVGAWWLATRGGWRSAAAAGACAAAAIAINPALGVLVPLAAFELWRARGPSRRGVRFAAAAGGAVAVVGPLVLWLGLAGALDDMWIQVVEQVAGSVRHSVEYASYGPPSGVKDDLTLWDVPAQGLWALGIVGCLAGMFERRLRRVAIPALLWIVASWLRVKVATYEYPHQYVPALAGISAGVAVGAAALWPAGTLRRVALAALVLASPVWAYVLQPQIAALRVPGYLRSSSSIAWGVAYPVAEYVRRHTTPKDRLFVSNSHSEVYWIAQRRAPTRFFDDFPVLAHPVYGFEQRRDLLRHPPRAVVIVGVSNPDPPTTDLFKTGRYRMTYTAGPAGSVWLRYPARPRKR